MPMHKPTQKSVQMSIRMPASICYPCLQAFVTHACKHLAR